MERPHPPAARRIVARNLRRMRLARNLTQEELAAAARVRQAQISEIEAGKLNVRIDTLERVATALGARLSDLFDETIKSPLPVGGRSRRRRG